MSSYAIGDLQGCHSRLGALLDLIETAERDIGADSDSTRYFFVGDLVNRGPQSLETLRALQAMGSRVQVVLGNHDLHLLAVAAGLRKNGRSDTLDAILQAPDRENLIDWLRCQPLACTHENYLFVHAGVPPQWSAAETMALAGEVQAALQSPGWIDFLRNMYGNQPARWEPMLTGYDRLRCIVNALTRLRLCTADGTMVHERGKGDVMADESSALMPWFDVPGRCTGDVTVVYGHWSALGLQMRPNLLGLDTGCVWGGHLTAIRLEDRRLFQVSCPQYQVPSLSGG
ncbi:MAG: symmetrical bis(5'-nucleosyl)-tetraphosphatase [Pseudomonadota bacterium]